MLELEICVEFRAGVVVTGGGAEGLNVGVSAKGIAGVCSVSKSIGSGMMRLSARAGGPIIVGVGLGDNSPADGFCFGLEDLKVSANSTEGSIRKPFIAGGLLGWSSESI
ncbi:hypothetical protein FWD07_00260 [Candidatus Saccharibacteria bacterium]|nr:hypothetical protein [Candidatus Saccharibacteria bacterium]